MSASCRRTAAALLVGDGQVDPTHLERCAACRRLLAGHRAARRALVAHHADLEPDAGFSARVLERIAAPEDPFAALGWAARRLLPLAAALVLVLAGWGVAVDRPQPVEPLLWSGASDEQLVVFLLSGVEDGR